MIGAELCLFKEDPGREDNEGLLDNCCAASIEKDFNASLFSSEFIQASN